MKINKFLYVFFLCFSLSTFAFAQDVYVPGNGNRAGYYRTRADDTVNNNYSTKGNTNPYTGKAGTKSRDSGGSTEGSSQPTGGPGTGEYFLVPAIVRKDPIGTAFRFNTCGTAIIALLDRAGLGGLTDSKIQGLYPEVVMTVAESRFRMATEYDSGNYVYHTNLALILFRQNKDEEALLSILKAIELNSKDEKLREYEALIRREKTTVIVLEDKE